jgi:hypothetical protein
VRPQHSKDLDLEEPVNTYDPADWILYVHPAPCSSPETGETCHRLPVGYANGSPGTRLGHRGGRLQRSLLLVQSRLDEETSELLPTEFRPIPA